jgi:hypothetical protein
MERAQTRAHRAESSLVTLRGDVARLQAMARSDRGRDPQAGPLVSRLPLTAVVMVSGGVSHTFCVCGMGGCLC